MATWQDWANKYRFLETNDQGWSTYDTALERLLGAQPGRWRRTRQSEASPSWIEWQNNQGQWERRQAGGGEYNPFWLAQHGGSIAWDDPNLLLYKSGLVSMDDVRAYKQSLSGGAANYTGGDTAPPGALSWPGFQAEPTNRLGAGQGSMRSALVNQLAPASPRGPSRNQLGFLRSLGGRGY